MTMLEAKPIGGVAPRRRKGHKANWNTEAKMRTFLIAESCIKATGAEYKVTKGALAGTVQSKTRSPYRDAYDDGRSHYADAVHNHECSQCGLCSTCGEPPGKNAALHLEETGCKERKVAPAQPGSQLRDGHKHARAMRLVMKAFLKDLWLKSVEVDLTFVSAGETPEETEARWDSYDSTLNMYAATVTGIEDVRKSTNNRIGAIRRGIEAQTGVPFTPEAWEMHVAGSKDLGKVHEAAQKLEEAERAAVKALELELRNNPLYGFVKSTSGLGDKTVARLLGSIGWPGRRANVAKLWAYCGLHVLASPEAD